MSARPRYCVLPATLLKSSSHRPPLKTVGRYVRNCIFDTVCKASSIFVSSMRLQWEEERLQRTEGIVSAANPGEGKKGQTCGGGAGERGVHDGVIVNVYMPGVNGVTDCHPGVLSTASARQTDFKEGSPVPERRHICARARMPACSKLMLWHMQPRLLIDSINADFIK